MTLRSIKLKGSLYVPESTIIKRGCMQNRGSASGTASKPGTNAVISTKRCRSQMEIYDILADLFSACQEFCFGVGEKSTRKPLAQVVLGRVGFYAQVDDDVCDAKPVRDCVVEVIAASAHTIERQRHVEGGWVMVLAHKITVVREARVVQLVDRITIDMAGIYGAERLGSQNEARAVSHEGTAHPEYGIAGEGVDAVEPVWSEGPGVRLHVKHVAIGGVDAESGPELGVAASRRGEIAQDVKVVRVARLFGRERGCGEGDVCKACGEGGGELRLGDDAADGVDSGAGLGVIERAVKVEEQVGAGCFRLRGGSSSAAIRRRQDLLTTGPSGGRGPAGEGVFESRCLGCDERNDDG
jgi:hypothetical protein